MANTIDKTTDEALLRSIIDGSIEEFEDDSITKIGSYKFYGCTNLTSLKVLNADRIESYGYANSSSLKEVIAPEVTQIWGKQTGCTNLENLYLPKLNQFNSDQVISHTKVTSLVFPNFTGSLYSSCIEGNSLLEAVDIYSPTSIPGLSIRDNTALGTIIIRSSTLVPLSSVNAFRSSKFDNSTGGTLYVPQSLITEYQNATNWSTILAYTNNQILPIEGSIYENYYADGTPIGLSSYGLIGYYAVGESGRYEAIENVPSHINSSVDSDLVAWTTGSPLESSSGKTIPTVFYNGYCTTTSSYSALDIYSDTSFFTDSDVITVEFSMAENISNAYTHVNTVMGRRDAVTNSFSALTDDADYLIGANGRRNFNHKILEFYKDGTIKFYVNGVLRKTYSCSNGQYVNSNTIAVGSGFTSGTYLGPVAIYNRALTSDEIAEHYQFYVDNYMVGQNVIGLIAEYDVGDESKWNTSTETISSDMPNEFVAWGQPAMAAALGNGDVPTTYYNGYASHYGGIQIYFGQPLSDISNTVTIQYLLASNYASFSFDLKAAVKSSTSSSVANTWQHGYVNGLSDTNRVFHLVTVELNSTGINKAYIDTTLVEESVSLNNCMTITALGIGSQNGYLGHVRVWNRALTTDEITQHYNHYVETAMVGQTAFDSEGNFIGGYISGKPYNITWNQGYTINSSGAVNSSESTQDYVSELLPCRGASAITVTTTGNAWVANSVWFYDESGNPISVRGNIDMIPVPINAYYLRNYVRTSSSTGSPNSTIVPYVYDKLTEDSEYELNTYYVLEYPTATTEPIKERSNPAYCYGATKLLTSLLSSSNIYFLDESKNDISNITCNRNDVSVEIDIPNGTYYIQLYPNSGNTNPWIMFTA